MASAPASTANWASSGSIIPLRTSLPPHFCLTHSTSSQFKVGSNCSAVQEDKELRSLTPLACPTILPNERRGVCNICQHQRGLVAKLSRFLMVGRGGVERPFLISR